MGCGATEATNLGFVCLLLSTLMCCQPTEFWLFLFVCLFYKFPHFTPRAELEPQLLGRWGHHSTFLLPPVLHPQNTGYFCLFNKGGGGGLSLLYLEGRGGGHIREQEHYTFNKNQGY